MYTYGITRWSDKEWKQYLMLVDTGDIFWVFKPWYSFRSLEETNIFINSHINLIYNISKTIEIVKNNEVSQVELMLTR